MPGGIILGTLIRCRSRWVYRALVARWAFPRHIGRGRFRRNIRSHVKA